MGGKKALIDIQVWLVRIKHSFKVVLTLSLAGQGDTPVISWSSKFSPLEQIKSVLMFAGEKFF